MGKKWILHWMSHSTAAIGVVYIYSLSQRRFHDLFIKLIFNSSHFKGKKVFDIYSKVAFAQTLKCILNNFEKNLMFCQFKQELKQ